MLIINWLKKRSKIQKTSFIIFALLFFIFTIWFVVVAYASIDVTPNRFQILNTSSPSISADWPLAIGTTLNKIKITLDGKDISNRTKLSDRGFSYKSNKLNEGEHVVKAKLKYGVLIPKTVTLEWRFITDTIAPKVNLDNFRSTTIATPKPDINLTGSGEPFSEMEFFLNGSSFFSSNIGEKGKFNVRVAKLNEKNILVAKAKDKAGNITTKKYTLIIDTKPPVVKQISPSHGKVLFTASGHGFKAVVKDNESGISKVNLKFNGKLVSAKFDNRKGVLVHNGTFTKDGRYNAELEIVDVAGNKTIKKWSFVVDTSRIIVDQSDFKLYFYKANKLVQTISVAVGMPNYATPNGNWKVVDKQVAPPWRNPHTSWSSSMPHIIPGGPSSPLGLRALYLDAPAIRIHGTSAYGSIGRRASHGCVRVRNPEIVEFYPKINVGTPVLIRP